MLRASAFESQTEPASGFGRTRLTLALLSALTLSAGCATISPDLGDQPPELTGAFPEDYLDIVKRWIDSDFRDISTVTNLQVSTPIAGHSQRLLSRKRHYGWYAKVTFKARDSVGASKGRMAYSVLLRDGAIVSSRKLLY